MLQQLHLQNFRGFESLELTGLRRVNLIVGRNNTGKTSVLEGLHLLLSSKSQQIHENPLRADGSQSRHDQTWFIGSKSKAASIRGKTVTSPTAEFKADLKIQADYVDINSVGRDVNVSVSSVKSMDSQELVRVFGLAVLRKGGEEQIETVLGAIDNRIRKVRVDPTSGQNRLVVDVGLKRLIPISELGQGVIRLVEVLSLLIGEESEVCIIDEIENGIHHSVLRDVWNGIAEAAERLNVQVFATTHSGECIEAAHDAFAARKEYDFSVIQLFRVKEGRQGRVLDRRLIEAALAGDIDLRGE